MEENQIAQLDQQIEEFTEKIKQLQDEIDEYKTGREAFLKSTSALENLATDFKTGFEGLLKSEPVKAFQEIKKEVDAVQERAQQLLASSGERSDKIMGKVEEKATELKKLSEEYDVIYEYFDEAKKEIGAALENHAEKLRCEHAAVEEFSEQTKNIEETLVRINDKFEKINKLEEKFDAFDKRFDEVLEILNDNHATQEDAFKQVQQEIKDLGDSVHDIEQTLNKIPERKRLLGGRKTK